MMFGLSCAILMRALLRLSLLVKILTIASTKLSFRPGESLDNCFARFESIVCNLRYCGPLAYSHIEHAKQLLYSLDDHVSGMKITALEESANFATLDTKKLLSKLKSHELSRKGHLNHDASLSSKALVTIAHVGSHDANPTNTVSSALEFALSSLVEASDERFESIPNDEIALLVRKFRKESWRSPRGCLSYLVLTPKPSTHRMHDSGSIVPHIRTKGFTDNQMP
jgi:hypothetical protein